MPQYNEAGAGAKPSPSDSYADNPSTPGMYQEVKTSGGGSAPMTGVNDHVGGTVGGQGIEPVSTSTTPSGFAEPGGNEKI